MKNEYNLSMRPLKNANFCSSSRKAKNLTTGIYGIFRGLNFESDAEIGQKGVFFKGLTIFSLSLILLLFSPQISSGQEKTNKSLYKIGVGDVLEIITWKEPDFSREEVLVRSDGMVTFPLLNDIEAAGRTTIDLKNDIENGLKDYISNPIVTVTVRTPTVNVKKFYILGEVENTGEYDLTKELTVLQAFALAGGFTEWASKKEIIVLRNENGKEKTIRVNYKNIVRGNDLSQNIKIKANDTIVVP